jgi:hypothetical protein
MQRSRTATVSILAAGIAFASPFALGASSPASGGGGITTATQKQADAKPIEDLELAAQRLRDAIHVMAQAPAGPKRSQAIRDGNRALFAVSEAIASLPPELLTAQADEGKYKQAVDRLEQAAQKLRDATHALAADKTAKRKESMAAIDRALLDTQQVMIDVPRSAWGPGQTAANTR